MRRRLRILTWHVHGKHFFYLTQVPHDFDLVADPDRGAGTCRSRRHPTVTGRPSAGA